MVKITFQLKGERALRSYLDRVGRIAKPLTVKASEKYLRAVAKDARKNSKGPWSRGGPESISNSINVLRQGTDAVKLTVTSPHARMQEEGIGNGFISAPISMAGRVHQRRMPMRGEGGAPKFFAQRVEKFRPKKFLSKAIDKNERLLNTLLSKAGDKILGGK